MTLSEPKINMYVWWPLTCNMKFADHGEFVVLYFQLGNPFKSLHKKRSNNNLSKNILYEWPWNVLKSIKETLFFKLKVCFYRMSCTATTPDSKIIGHKYISNISKVIQKKIQNCFKTSPTNKTCAVKILSK